jgi:pilus assembly protein Flp/PilA
MAGFLRCEGGSTAIEYALIATLIAIALITALTALGQALVPKYEAATVALQ